MFSRSLKRNTTFSVVFFKADFFTQANITLPTHEAGLPKGPSLSGALLVSALPTNFSMGLHLDKMMTEKACDRKDEVPNEPYSLLIEWVLL